MSEERRVRSSGFDRGRGLRLQQTPAEAKLRACLRNRRVAGLKFRRQHSIGRYIVDFYCAACRLVVEIDGGSHAYAVAHDRERTAWLNERAYGVIRFRNGDVFENLERVADAILDVCDKGNVSPSPQPSPQGREGALAEGRPLRLVGGPQRETWWRDDQEGDRLEGGQ